MYAHLGSPFYLPRFEVKNNNQFSQSVGTHHHSFVDICSFRRYQPWHRFVAKIIPSAYFSWSVVGNVSRERVQARFRRWDRFGRHGDEIPDTSHLGMWLKVNVVFRQRSSTSEMIVDVPTLVSYVSQFVTLLPGDVISTGARAGVGLGMRPPQYLKAGDVIELGIEQVGELRQTVVAWQSIAIGTVCSHPAR
jgi:hypothetical protein